MHSAARLDSLRFCPALPHPPVNGYLCTPPSSAPGMVHFCCNKGYSLTGISMASCNLDTRKWEPDTPNCLRRLQAHNVFSCVFMCNQKRCGPGNEFMQFVRTTLPAYSSFMYSGLHFRLKFAYSIDFCGNCVLQV